MEWVKKNKVIALIIAALGILVLGSVINGVSIRTQAKGYFDLAKGWANAYHRDIGEAKKQADEQIKILTKERDQARRKYQIALEMMKTPWKPPADAQEMEKRFRDRGLKARVTP